MTEAAEIALARENRDMESVAYISQVKKTERLCLELAFVVT